MQRVDVAIVGGGPAGSAAGHAAASRGAETVIIEKGVPREDRSDLGPDSTDAAGILDYWVDLMDLDEPIPETVKHQELSGADFIGTEATLSIDQTGIDASYPNFGFTVHRAKFDDWLRARAEDAGATYRVGSAVSDYQSELAGQPSHKLTLRDGSTIQTDALILADGPQRTITGRVLEQWLDSRTLERLASHRANHIAYQEYRKMPSELFEPDRLKFWWGYIPGHTAYPWVFPNDEPVARIGLTMPIGLDLSAIPNRSAYCLLEPTDETIPNGQTYIERLLETVYPEFSLDDFPLLTDRGKRDGTETYPISSTRPIESPVAANVAITGGAMAATSAFHEGGDHVAIRTGSIAGELAANGRLDAYNSAWQSAIGTEIRRNVVFADMVEGYEPADWNAVFQLVNTVLDSDGFTPRKAARTSIYGAKLFAQYRWLKYKYRGHRYVQVSESEFTV